MARVILGVHIPVVGGIRARRRFGALAPDGKLPAAVNTVTARANRGLDVCSDGNRLKWLHRERAMHHFDESRGSRVDWRVG